MHDSPTSSPVTVSPGLMLAGLVWGAGNVLAEVGGPSFLAVLGPILIGAAAVGNLLFGIYKYVRQHPKETRP